MANLSLIEQLDQAVEALIANRDATLLNVGPEVAPLLRVAAELRNLPREQFRTSLKEELTSPRRQARAPLDSKAETSSAKTSTIRRGFRTVTPYIAVKEAPAVIDFVQTVFGAEGKVHGTGSQGGIHSEYEIDGSMVMIGGGSQLSHPSRPAALHLYVKDVDTVYRRALSAGATSLYEPTDHEYGERGASVRDAGGNHWYLATAKGPGYVPEGAPNLMPYLHPRGAPKLIEFLKNAFGAEEESVYQSPEGIVYHAKVKIGNSIVEIGEAHDQWQPMPSMFMLYVDDVDAWYARAIKAEGAVSVSVPADQPYGDRVGAVKDPFDNLWYIGTHLKDVGFQEEKSEELITSSSERSQTMADVPRLFRVMLEVSDLDKAVAFYSNLLGIAGRVLRGSRAYFDCGPVILALLDPTPGGIEPKPNAADVYFAVSDIEQIHLRARELNCLSPEEVHGESAGEIVTRPWGERSFYVKDPWGNGLCFVDESTLFTGK